MLSAEVDVAPGLQILECLYHHKYTAEARLSFLLILIVFMIRGQMELLRRLQGVSVIVPYVVLFMAALLSCRLG